MKTRKTFLISIFLAVPTGLWAIDTDGDGLDDAVETNTGIYVSPTDTGTNPNKADSDGDGASDWYEVYASHTNPNDPNDHPVIPYPLPRPDPADTGISTKPVKVFIMSGQSNMVGMAVIDPIGTAGTLANVVKQQGKFPNLLDASGNWAVRNDVIYRGVIAANGNNGPLAPGQGSDTAHIGPELGFGQVMGYYFDEPVLLIKTSQGGRALGWDFLPPGSQRYDYTDGNTYAGYGDSPASWATGSTPVAIQAYGGYQYDQCFLRQADWAPGSTFGSVANATDILDNFATQYPQWAAQGFEIAGFVWWQGWNDGMSYTPAYAYHYEQNLAQLIRKLREYYELKYPTHIRHNAPFVLATCGFQGWTNPYATRAAVANGQLAVADPVKYPEFAGNVKCMESRDYWRDSSVSPTAQEYHYNGNAETYMLVGDALGRGMIELITSANPDTTPPAVSTFSPANNATSVPITSNLVLTFNESIVTGTGNITLTDLTDSTQTVIAITDTTQVSVAGAVLTINPAQDLGALKSYAIRIDAGAVTDLSDNPYAGITDDTTWAFTTVLPDTTPPTPNPMTWATTPAAISTSSIGMTATTASDPSGVQYYFTCTAGGGHDSGWQDSPSYTDTGLTQLTSYAYTVKARDKSAAANLTTTSVSSSATTLSPPPTAGAVVYEPFADSDATLPGNTPGTGLSGTWSATASRFTVNAAALSWGTLPVSGNQVKYVPIGNAACSVALGTALTNAGLLADGATLWFSVLINTPGDTGANPDTGFAIGTTILGSGNNLPIAAGEQAIGWTIKNGKLQATIWNGGAATRNSTGPAVTANTPKFIVGQIIWGANSTANDTINLYTPNTSLAMGSIVNSYTAVLNQAAFDTVTIALKTNTNAGFAFDEIRFGPTYDSVIGAATAVPDYTSWATRYPGANLTNPDADLDGDGLSNNFERVFGLDPTSAASQSAISISPTAGGTITYTRRDPALTGMVYSVWTSSDLQAWTEDTAADARQVAGAPDANGVQTVTVTPTATPVGGRLFVRIKAQ